MTLALRYAARSDRGLVRGNNQDSVYAGPRLLAVADGMGGHAAGDVASKVVIAALEHLDDDAPSGDMLQALREAVFDGSEHLREVIRESPQLEGMGTTLTAVLFAGGRLALLSDAEGHGNVYSVAADGSDLRRHTDHDTFYARQLTGDGDRLVYQHAGRIWRLDSLAPDSQPYRLEVELGSSRSLRAPVPVKVADHLGQLAVDSTGRASAACASSAPTGT